MSDASHSTPPASMPVSPPRSPKVRRWGLILVILLGLGAAAVWFLPDIVARTALRQQVPKILFPFFKGDVELGETSLGWTSPVVVKKVRVADESGETLLSIGEVRSSATLWELATSDKSLGRFDLSELAAKVISAPNGTNFDKAISDFLTAPATGASRPFELVCLGAKVLLNDRRTDATATLPPIDLHLRVGLEKPKGITLELTSRTEDDQAASLELKLLSEGDAAKSPLQLNIHAREWQLAQLSPLLRLWRPGGQIWGLMNGEAAITATGHFPDHWECDSDLTIQDLELLQWDELKGDAIRLKQLRFQGKVEQSNQMLSFQKLQLQSEVADITADGRFRLPESLEINSAPLDEKSLVAALDDDFAFAGWIDAAAIAQQLPTLLQLRSDTQLQEGRLNFDLASARAEGEEREWKGQLQLNRLAAVMAQERWEWDSPLQARWTLRNSSNGLVFEDLNVASDFLQAHATGTTHQGELSAEADLQKLSEKLNAILKQDGTRAAGSVQLQVNFAALADQQVSLKSRSVVSGFSWGPIAAPYWTEPELQADLSAVGSGPPNTPWQRLESVQFDVTAGSDTLQLKLLQPVSLTERSESIPLQGEVRGDLSRWARRLQPFVETDLATLRGEGVATAIVYWSDDEVVVEKAKVTSSSASWSSPQWNIRAHDIEAETQGRWNLQSQTWTSPETVIRGNFGRVVWKNGQYDGGAEATFPMSGDLEFQVDAGQISQWRGGPADSHILGQAGGTIRCVPTADGVTFAMTADVQRMVYAVLVPLSNATPSHGPIPAKWVARWKEPHVQLQAQGKIATNSHKFELRNVHLVSEGLSLRGDLQGEQQANHLSFSTAGDLTYDWARLSTRMDPELAKKFQLTGTGSRPFQLQGSWDTHSGLSASTRSTSLAGQASMGWTTAKVLGLTLGPGDVRGRFQGNRGQIDPITLEVAEGRVSLAPQFQFGEGVSAVQLAPGRVIDRVRLTPEICRDSLRLVLPLLADATQIEGRFSVDLAAATWPISDFGSGTASGQMIIEQAQLVPGGMTNQLLGVVEQIRNLVRGRSGSTPLAQRIQVELPAQTVRFQQSQRRVAHDRLIIRTPDITIETRGSVGLDESLDLIASLPISEEWLTSEQLKQVFSGQTIQIPIRGTLRQPQIDPRIFQDLARRAAGNAVERVIEGRLQDQLNRLFPRR